MKVTALDHIVLAVADVERTCRFYERVLGMEPRQERPGKWSLHFGTNKISLQDARASPDIARDTVPGSGNFCLLTVTPIDEVVRQLSAESIEIVAGPGERSGAVGAILSVYFKDPDENLVEVSNRLWRSRVAALKLNRSATLSSCLSML
ncbi:VOC family protein [Mesorhizobium sp. M00.F.Ca.ET.216.01.1.1]|uniref:VOC family protein n=1 Tax=Mesorhizobium sp. M00.F.Ca.ET.216.01.1.1 TaxID=2500528 RepID=UPI001FE1173A|nr:VOC family protein [Mesorhizobium sp. M00.F.Ca.ET.216.01.1.1]